MDGMYKSTVEISSVVVGQEEIILLLGDVHISVVIDIYRASYVQ